MAIPGPNPPERPARRRPVRLWPLLVLPIVGLIVGIVSGHRSAVNAGFRNSAEPVIQGAKGLALGSVLMSVVAFGVLAVRLAVRRYTLRSMLFVVAAVALVLGAVRACGP